MNSQLIGRRYQPINELGSGSMGRLYRAVDHLTGRTIALKQVTTPTDQLLFATRVSHGDNRLALTQEFKTLSSLRHPHIISVIDYGFDHQGQPFFTMELHENAKTLIDAGRDKPLAVQIHLLTQVLQALVYLHRHGVIHRDLKPSNVLVTSDQVKVVDFGLAVKGSHPEGESAGTLAYMAPEVLQGNAASESSDLYAVGIMAYELLVGRHPFNLEVITTLINDIFVTTPNVSMMDKDIGAVLSRLLSKAADGRYHDAREVISALSQAARQAVSAETISIRESFLQSARLVGRESELHQLTDMLHQAFAGNGAACLVAGESGVGKSRLLDEIRALALVEGALVLRGQGISEGGKLYQLWREPLRWLCLQTELGELEASVLKALVPDISALLGYNVPDAPELEAQPTKERLLTTILDVFRSQEHPILIILEDLHWANESLDVLARLVPLAHELPLLIVASYRDDERADLPEKLPGAQVLKLRRLGERDIAELSEGVLGSAGRKPEIVNLLKRETEGNPFFIVEVLRALAEEAKGLDQIGSIALPQNVFAGGMQVIVRRRLERVPEQDRPLLRLAAVAGRELDLKLLDALSPNSDLTRWLGVCADCFVLEIHEEHWRFTHDKLRDAMLAEISESERQLLHRQVAEALERVYPDDVARLAYHWGSANEGQKEAYYAAAAGELALRNGAFRDSITFLERVIALAPSTEMSAAATADIKQKLCEAYIALGDIAGMQAHSNSAMELLNYRTPTGKRALWMGIARQMVRQLGHRVSMDGLSRPIKQMPKPNPLLTAARLSERQAQIAYLFNQKELTLFHGFRGLNLVEKVGDANAEKARFYSTMCLLTGLVPLHSAASRYEALASKLIADDEDYDAESWVMLTRGIYQMGRGQWEKGESALLRGVALADQIGSARRSNECRNALTLPYLCVGRWDDCIAICEALAHNTARFMDVENQMWGLAYHARCLLLYGQIDDALQLLVQSEALFDSVFDNTARLEVLSVRLKYQLVTDQMELAHESAEKIHKVIADISPTSFLLLDVYGDLAEFYLRRLENQSDPAAHQWAQLACRLLGRFAKVFDIGKPRASLYQGLYAHLQRKPAHTEFEQAVQSARQLKMPYDEGLAEFTYGRVLERGDVRREAHLRRSVELFQRLGASHQLRQAQAALGGG